MGGFMKNLQQELADFIMSYVIEKDAFNKDWYASDFAQAIIAKYPQIEKQPMKIEVYEYDTPSKKVEYAIKLFQPFDSKLDRMQWIEEHYCEVFE